MAYDQQNQNDFSSCLIIKVSLGDDTRKFPIANDDITYDELLIMMQRIFKGKLHASDDVTIKYRDDDEDLVTIHDTSDLGFAVACNKLLKLTLFVNEKPIPLETDEVRYIKKQLQQMRDLSNDLLDRLEIRAAANLVNGEMEPADAAGKEESQKEAAPQPPTGGGGQLFKQGHPGQAYSQPNSLDHSYEFDPLHQKAYRQPQQRIETECEEKHQVHGVGRPPCGGGGVVVVEGSPAPLTGSRTSINESADLSRLATGALKESRPDTPSSLDSYKERAGSQKPAENVQSQHVQQKMAPQQDVAMIQPSLHQQINAPPLAQMGGSLNGPTAGAPIQQQQHAYGGAVGGAAVPPPPPTQYQQQQQQPMGAPYQQPQQVPRPASAHALHQPPQPQYFGGQAPPPQPAPGHHQYPPAQQPHAGHAPPPVSQPPVAYAPYAQQQYQAVQAPPSSLGYAQAPSQYAAAPPPPPSSIGQPQQQAPPPPPPGSSMIGPPPTVGGASSGGANPFARHSQSPYVRPPAFTGASQY